MGLMMIEIDTLTIKDAREAIENGKAIAAALGADQPAGHSATPGLYATQIVILDRGWVYVGTVSINGDWCTIENAQCIRRWGTTAGLGELAAKGPLPETKLEPTGLLRAPLKSIIAMIKCEVSKW